MRKWHLLACLLVVPWVAHAQQLNPNGFPLQTLTGAEIVECQDPNSPYITTCTTQQIANLAVGVNACTQDFLANASPPTPSFIPGTTTILTTTCGVPSAASLSIYFDGLRRSANTWSLAGQTVTFLIPVQIGVQVVEFHVD